MQNKTPKVPGIRTLLRVFLYISLISTGALSLLARPHLVAQVRAGLFPASWVLIGPGLFALFFLVFAIDEIFIRGPKKGKHRAGIVPLVFGALVIVFLLPSSFQEYRARRTADLGTPAFYYDLFKSKDARVRALVMVASSQIQGSTQDWVQLMNMGLSDPDPLVQASAVHQVADRMGAHLSEDSNGVEEAKALLSQVSY